MTNPQVIESNADRPPASGDPRVPAGRLAADLWIANVAFEHVGRIMDLAADYALTPEFARVSLSYDETIYALLAGAAALQRETIARVTKIQEDLHADQHAAQV
ncbi:MAG TPA: hypothetical protein VHZ26_04845 [Caulobacteraceae bacterium]|jgi:hypothetical protein|nr:hypothetical protein [Caulobacteraceae bacterium]